MRLDLPTVTMYLWLFPLLSLGAALADPGSPSAPKVVPPSYREALLNLHRELVSVESISGNEHNVGLVLSKYLAAHGFQTKSVPVTFNTTADHQPHMARYNILAWPGTSSPDDLSSIRVVVTSHIDTVPPFIPYDTSPGNKSSSTSGNVTSSTVLRGRGSVDAKAAVAAQVIALQELVGGGNAGTAGSLTETDRNEVALLYVVGEETGGDGMRSFSRTTIPAVKLDARLESVIFGEPTENTLACGHKGYAHCLVRARGKSAHSGYPWLGKSATEVLIRGLTKLLQTDLGSSANFKNTTVNVGVIRGGVAGNVVAAEAEADITVRVAIGPAETGGDLVVQRLKDVFKEVDPQAFEVGCEGQYGVVECNCKVPGFRTAVMNYGTDIQNLKGVNVTRYLYGPGSIQVAHSDHEALTVGDLEDSVEGYKKLIMYALKSGTGYAGKGIGSEL